MSTQNLSRRQALATTAGAAAAPALARIAGASQGNPDPAGVKSTPDKAPRQDPSQAGPSNNPAIGKPVSDTAAAQGGEPTVPGPPPRKLGVAIVGIGKLTAEEILPAFAQCQHARLAGLVSGDPNKARAFGDRYGIEPRSLYGYRDYDGIAENADIDAVYIVLPNSMHAEYTVRAARAGKHVLCEKPMATGVADCDRMIEACEAAGRRLMIAYRVHYEPINAQMKAWIKDRKYGKPHFVAFDAVQDVGGPGQYRLDAELNGGGSMWDIGIYPLNTTRYLLGEEPEEVKATMWSDPEDPRFAEIEQNIAFQMRFPSGCIATCTSSFGTARVNRYRVMCQKGWLGMEPATSYRGLKGQHGDEEQRVEVATESVNQFAAEIDHFARCIKEGRETDTPGEEGRRDVRLMLAIYESARSGRAVKV